MKLRRVKSASPKVFVGGIKSSPFSKHSLLVYAAFFAVIAGGYAIYNAFAASEPEEVLVISSVCSGEKNLEWVKQNPNSPCPTIGNVTIVTDSVGSSEECNPNPAKTNAVDQGFHGRVSLLCPTANDGGYKTYRFMGASRDGYTLMAARFQEKKCTPYCNTVTTRSYLQTGDTFKVRNPTSEATFVYGIDLYMQQIPTTDPLALGTFDGIDGNGTAFGWACDASNYGVPVKVDFYADKDAWAGGTYLATVTANLTREAGVANNCGGWAAHGFTWKVPDNLKGRNIYAHAINIGADGAIVAAIHPTLFNSPKVYTPANPPPNPAANLPIGGVDLSGGTVFGWSCDPDSWTTQLSIHFYVDQPAGQPGAVFAGTTTADMPWTDDVTKSCGGSKAHGFGWSIPESLRNNTERKIYAYAINVGAGSGNPLLYGSPKSFKLGPSPVIKYFKALKSDGTTASTIYRGQSILLMWGTSNASSCSATGGLSGTVATNQPSGLKLYPMTNPTTYVLTCKNTDGVQVTKTVKVAVRSYKVYSNSISPTKPCSNSRATYTARVVRNIDGKGLKGVTVKFKVYYKGKTVTYKAGKTNSKGQVSKSFKVSNVKGYKVKVTTHATLGKNTVSKSTSFTPKGCS